MRQASEAFAMLLNRPSNRATVQFASVSGSETFLQATTVRAAMTSPAKAQTSSTGPEAGAPPYTRVAPAATAAERPSRGDAVSRNERRRPSDAAKTSILGSQTEAAM